jgi:CHAT domain-containing protein
MVQLSIGSFKKAQLYADKSLKSKVFEAKILEGIADAYDLLKENHTALSYHQQAYELIKDKSYQAEEQANILSDIAKNYIQLSQDQKAVEPLEKALNIMESIHGKLYPQTIRLNNLLGIIKEGKGHFQTSLKNQRLLYGKNSLELADLYYDIALKKERDKVYDKVLGYYTQAIEIYSKNFPIFHEKCYNTHYHLAEVEKKLGNSESYFTHALSAFDGFSKNQEIIFSTLSTQEKKRYRTKHKKFINMLFHAHNQKHTKELFNRWLNYKRKLFDEENAIKRLTLQGENTLLIQAYKKSKKDLAQAFQQNNIDKSYIETLKNKINNLERQFSLKFFHYKKAQHTINYQQISQILEPNELYIDFAKIDNNYYLFTLNHNKEVKLKKISTKNSKIIENKIDKFQEDINKKSYVKKNGFHFIMGKFYNILFKTLDLKKYNSLIISPDASLNLIPFETLYDGKNYLIERVNISYIPSGRELINDNKQNKSLEKMSIFAKSNFSDYKTLENLNYSIHESQSIKKFYPNALFFTEDQATKKQLFQLIKPKQLHLSTHGAYDIQTENENPLLNTFLYLDKPISGLELSALNLEGTKLVVLSACQTALGEVENAEGVSSMAKAFMEAGAKDILVTLWSIDDKASSHLMKRFYFYLKKGLSHKDALRQAKLELLKSKEFSEPYLWSAMILMGHSSH